MNKNIKKIGKAVAGSALLVGATLTGAAGLASAADGTQDLGDYPTPFVADDGEVQSTVVVGDSAKTVDVVGAVNIAGSLGNAAFGEESVDVGGTGAVASWSAENGVTLNRQNSNLFLSDASDAELSRLDEGDLNALESTSFQSADNEEVEVEYEAEVGNHNQGFQVVGDEDDPRLHLDVPTSSLDTNSLFSASVEFSDSIDFTAAGTDDPESENSADQYLEDGDTLTLFGTEYTFSDESDSDELVLYGSSENFEVNTGESTTVSIDEEETTVEAQYVSEGDTVSATVTVDGNTQSIEEGDSITVNGQELRVSDIYRTGPDGQGRVAFSIGSEELTIHSDGDVELGGDDIDGVQVQLDSDNGNFDAVDGMSFHYGAADSDEDFLAAGETYEDPVFGALEFHYGGLSANAAEDPAETIEVNAAEESQATLTTTVDGEEADVAFTRDDGTFGPEDGDYAEFEGEELEEDDRVVLNSNEEAALYEVTDVSTDLSNTDLSDDDGSITVTLENVHTGESVEIEEDGLSDEDDEFSGDGDNAYTIQAESIEGKDFHVTVDKDDNVQFERSGIDEVQVLPHLYTDSDVTVAFYEYDDNTGEGPAPSANAAVHLPDLVDNDDFTGSDSDGSQAVTEEGNFGVEVNTDTADASSVEWTLYNSNDEVIASGSGNTVVSSINTGSSDTVERVEVTSANGKVTDITIDENDDDANSGTTSFDGDQPLVGDATKTVELPSGVASNDATVNIDFSATDAVSTGDKDLNTDLSDFVQVDYQLNGDYLEVGPDSPTDDPAAMVLQPEDDEEVEHGFLFNVDTDQSQGDIQVDFTGDGPLSNHGDDIENNDWVTSELDSEDDVDVGYNAYGTYTTYDDEDSDQETFSLALPGAQSTAGMAVTGTDGSVSASAGAGSATSATPMGWPDAAALDSDSNIDSLKTSDELILVGGPNVNALTAELADDNKTMTASEYEEGTAMVQVVNDAFAEGQDAVVVAGYAGEDTREAANYLANYADNSEDLAGQEKVELSTQQTQNAE